jgi:hypothetical protein
MGRKRARRGAGGGGGGGAGTTAPQPAVAAWPPALHAPSSVLEPFNTAAASGTAWFGSAPLPPTMRPPRSLVCGHLLHAARFLGERVR